MNHSYSSAEIKALFYAAATKAGIYNGKLHPSNMTMGALRKLLESNGIDPDQVIAAGPADAVLAPDQLPPVPEVLELTEAARLSIFTAGDIDKELKAIITRKIKLLRELEEVEVELSSRTLILRNSLEF